MNPLCLSECSYHGNKLFVLSDEDRLQMVAFRYKSLSNFASKHFPGQRIISGRSSLPVRQIQEYMEGVRQKFTVDYQLHGTPFQQKVWEGLKSIPFGQTKTYLQLAQELGGPRLTRAVANAISVNPLPIVVPCHRIIRSDGQLGGYLGGVDMKRQFLGLEKKVLSNEPVH